MKKKFVQLFAAMLALVCLLSLSACSGGGESSAPSESSASSAVEESQSESSESQAEQSALEAEEEAGSAAQSEAEAVASAEEEAAGEVTGMYPPLRSSSTPISYKPSWRRCRPKSWEWMFWRRATN